MLGRDLFPEKPAETCVGVYRARYSYYLGLVAGTFVLCYICTYVKVLRPQWNFPVFCHYLEAASDPCPANQSDLSCQI